MISAPSLAGMLFAVAWFVLADGIILMRREEDAANRPTFVTFLPALTSLLGFIVVSMTSPQDVQEAKLALEGEQGVAASLQGVVRSKPLMFLCLGWFICLSSTVGAFCMVGVEFLGDNSTRFSSYPGIAIVLHSCYIPLVAVGMWYAKASDSSQDDVW